MFPRGQWDVMKCAVRTIARALAFEAMAAQGRIKLKPWPKSFKNEDEEGVALFERVAAVERSKGFVTSFKAS